MVTDLIESSRRLLRESFSVATRTHPFFQQRSRVAMFALLGVALSFCFFSWVMFTSAEAAGAAPVEVSSTVVEAAPVDIGEPAVQERCWEDEPCFDPWTMGNRTVGVGFFDWANVHGCARLFGVVVCLVPSVEGEMAVVGFDGFSPVAAMRLSDGAVVAVVS